MPHQNEEPCALWQVASESPGNRPTGNRPTGSYCSVNTQHTGPARPAIGLRRILLGLGFQDEPLGIYQGDLVESWWWLVGGMQSVRS
jgi:hypothetical protein